MTVFEWMSAVVDVLKAHLQQKECDVVKLRLVESRLIDINWKPALRKVPDSSAQRMRRHRSKRVQGVQHVTTPTVTTVTFVTSDGGQPVDKSQRHQTPSQPSLSSPNTVTTVTNVTKSPSQPSLSSHVTSHSPSHVTRQLPLNGCSVNGAASSHTYPESSESDSESDSDQNQIRSQRKRGNAGEKETPAAQARRSRVMPPTFEPSTQLRAWAAAHAPLVNFENELAVIRDHEFKDPHAAWPAVVRNWLRRAQQQREQFNAKNGITPPRVFSDDDHSMDGMEGFLL